MRIPHSDIPHEGGLRHISEEDVFLLLDREMPPETLGQLESHLRSCEICQGTAASASTLLGAIRSAAANELAGPTAIDVPEAARAGRGPCPSDAELATYFERLRFLEENPEVKNHVSRCPRCIALFASSARRSAPEQVLELHSEERERIIREFRKMVREEHAEALLARFSKLAREAHHDIRDYLGEIGKGLVVLFRETFTYPTPAFASLAGTAPPAVISPFGKVRFPVLFRWEPFQQSDNYELSVEESGWSLKTTRSRILVEKGEAVWEPAREYGWTLQYRHQSSVLAAVRNAFSILNEQEAHVIAQIGDCMRQISPEEDRLTLWGGVLELGGLCSEAVQNYQRCYLMKPSAGVAYRVASCFDRFGLVHLRDRWNRRILECDANRL